MAKTIVVDTYVKKSQFDSKVKQLQADCAKKLPLSGGSVEDLEARYLAVGELSADFAEVKNLEPAEIYAAKATPLDLEQPVAMYELVEKTNQVAADFGIKTVQKLPNRPQSQTQLSTVARAVKRVAQHAGLEETAAAIGDEASVAQIAEALNEAISVLNRSVVSESLQQALAALGEAISGFNEKVSDAQLLALDVDAKLDKLDASKQPAGDYLTAKQIEKRFLDASSGGKIDGDVSFSGSASFAGIAASGLSVDFVKLVNASPERDLSKYVTHLQGSTLAGLQSKCNEMIAFAELPLLKITASDTVSEDFGRALTVRRVNEICKHAGVEGTSLKPTDVEMQLALNRALRTLKIFGSGVSLQTILQNYQTRSLLLEAIVGRCQAKLEATIAAAEKREAEQKSEIEAMRSQLAKMEESIEVTRQYYAGQIASVETGLVKNVELTPSKVQFAKLQEEVAQLRAELMAYASSSQRFED